ncbi:hypothetical protein [Sphingomonas nostoxanthinifaciens]|uniref:hypothetical protein n=1 Tax=Sphingomonas nostoxanthinifaciens TaxID=2872652 RepID=UPI001CC20F78|nr:hypothetical protein [Sphingomonas nostoxanthinifaciens]UAK26253.1 hypothetical protein K8P63_09235 [Sphingomonas nostoxanthinifaciens]
MIRHASARWRAAILVCAKCEKKLGGRGFGPDGRKPLSKVLRKHAGGGKGRKASIGVMQTKCLKICPKNAVTVVDGARPRDWLIVAAGTPIEDVEAALDAADAEPRAGRLAAI